MNSTQNVVEKEETTEKLFSVCIVSIAQKRSRSERKNRNKIICVPEIDIACHRVNNFMREQNRFRTSKTTNALVDKFIRDYESLTEYLQHPTGFVPTTVNISENMNKQLKDRLKPMCMFQSIQSAENYVNLWCLKRRFQKFTDCKKPFQYLNGKAPLEIAGCRINGLDYLSL